MMLTYVVTSDWELESKREKRKNHLSSFCYMISRNSFKEFVNGKQQFFSLENDHCLFVLYYFTSTVCFSLFKKIENY